MNKFISLKSLLRSAVLLILITCAHSASASTPISGPLTGNTTWTKADSPYVVSNVTIPAGTTLTIEPGVVVKMRPHGESGPLSVSGTLTIGTADATEQVVFTSLADDLVGGDTNGDGNSTSPNPGDWRNVTAEEGGVVRAYHTTFRYGGANTGYDYSCIGYCEYKTYASSQVFNHGGTVEVSDSSFTRSLSAQFAQSSGASTLRHSNFLNAPRGLSTTGGTVISDHNAFSNTSTGMSIGATTLSVLSNTFTNTPRNTFVLDGSSYTSDGRNTSDGSSFLLSGDAEGTLLFPAEGFTYVMGSTRIVPTGTLSFSPGAVLKITPEVNILVEGMLSIGSSTAPQWSLVTSLKDDDVGGDTNGDGATLPAQGDWRNIRIESGGTLQIAHTAFRYGGAPVGYDYVCHGYCGYTYYASGQVFNHGGSLLVDDSRFSDAYAHIYVHGGTSTITHTELIRARYRTIDVVSGDLSLTESSLHDTSGGSQGLNVLDGATVNATTDWWGDTSGPTHSTNASGTGILINGSATFTPWLTSAPDLAAPTFMDPSAFVPEEEGCVTKCYSNVLFLPGIMGSRLYWTDPNCLLVNCENKLWVPNRDDDVEKLYMATGTSLLSNVYAKESDIVSSSTIGATYNSLFIDLNTLVASGTIAEWKPIAYDWRYDYDHLLSHGRKVDGKIYYGLATDSPYIVQELLKLVSTSRTGKVTIVAHSNGGLLAKALIQKLEEQGKQNIIDNLILVASPQLGTPQAIGALLHGYDHSSYMRLLVHRTTQRTLSNNMPMAYNLLPSEEYFDIVDTPVAEFSEEVLPQYDLWGDNLNTYGEYLAFMSGLDGRPTPEAGELEDPTNINQTLLSDAVEWHRNYDNWAPPDGVKVYQIAGWGIDTVSGIKYSNDAWFGGFSWDYEPAISEDGDGTVVAPSALSGVFNAEEYWINLAELKKDKMGDYVHSNILEMPQLRSFIINNLITQSSATLSEYFSESRPSTIDYSKRLRYYLHSPLTLELYDEFGHHVGLSTSTDSIDLAIPGAYYNEFGDVKYISVPSEIPTRLVMRGEGSGTFTLNIEEVIGSSVISTTSFQNIPVSSTTLVSMLVPANAIPRNLSGLTVDQGDGTVVYVVNPGSMYTPDIIPPEAVIVFSTSTNSVVIQGIDETSSTTISSSTVYPSLKKNQRQYNGIATTTVSIKDLAGNTTILIYTEDLPSPTKLDVISLVSVSYNGTATKLGNTRLKYKWNISKEYGYTTFASFLRTTSTTTESHYRPKKNETILMTKPLDLDENDEDGEEVDVRPIKVKLSEMIIPGFQTKQGSVNVIY